MEVHQQFSLNFVDTRVVDSGGESSQHVQVESEQNTTIVDSDNDVTNSVRDQKIKSAVKVVQEG